MNKRARKISSRWERYRDKHNALRQKRNTSSLEKKIRVSSVKAKQAWLSGAFDVQDFTLEVKSFKPLALVCVAPGTKLKFFDVVSRALVNGSFLRTLVSSRLKVWFAVIAVGDDIHCCPFRFCEAGWAACEPQPSVPMRCDYCNKYGICQLACESCDGPRFFHA